MGALSSREAAFFCRARWLRGLRQSKRGATESMADGATVHTIIGAADARMYAVKANGRGAVRGA